MSKVQATIDFSEHSAKDCTAYVDRFDSLADGMLKAVDPYVVETGEKLKANVASAKSRIKELNTSKHSQ